ncbi:parkin co-regulated protein-domain-containing protein [Geranomyces variabilis]|nr:parkin co-regulated protein-domain-containing protein [Geranomyces variabilis]KAJ3142210.1 hypothetical protein HDU90_004483 [Geranomyces variabilis]
MLSKTSTGRLDGSSCSVPKSSAAPPDRSAGSSRRPSSKLNAAVVQPLGNKKHLTAFGAMYARGEIPCRLNHGSVKHKITWSQPPDSLPYTILLPAFFAGLLETQHPYTHLVRTGLPDLLSAPSAAEKTLPLLPSLTAPLRAALGSRDTAVADAALNTLQRLAILVGPNLLPCLHTLVPPVAARVVRASAGGGAREACFDVLRSIEAEVGQPALKILKTCCPTYTSPFNGNG